MPHERRAWKERERERERDDDGQDSSACERVMRVRGVCGMRTRAMNSARTLSRRPIFFFWFFFSVSDAKKLLQVRILYSTVELCRV